MGKSYMRIKYVNGKPRYVSRLGAKVPKTSLHGRHHNQKNYDWQWDNRGKQKKYYESRKYITDASDIKLIPIKQLKTLK